jgi:hypothetical protein
MFFKSSVFTQTGLKETPQQSLISDSTIIKVKGWDFYIATLTERPAPLYTVGRLQVRTAEESGAIIDGKPPLQPTTVVPVCMVQSIHRITNQNSLLVNRTFAIYSIQRIELRVRSRRGFFRNQSVTYRQLDANTSEVVKNNEENKE